jgi:hypothetical protein
VSGIADFQRARDAATVLSRERLFLRQQRIDRLENRIRPVVGHDDDRD